MSTTERDRLFATLAIASGDRPLTTLGKEMMGASNAARLQARKTSIGNGFIMDPNTGQVVRDPGYAAWEQQRDALHEEQRARLQEQMLERLGYGADLRAKQPHYSLQETEGGVVPVQGNPLAPGGTNVGEVLPVTPPLPAGAKQKAAESERLAVEARALYEELSRTRGVVNTPKDILTNDVLPKVPVVGASVARATREALYSPEQLSVQTRGARFEQNLSNLAAGMALTGYELEQRNRWSPFVSGISQQEAQRRLENIERDFGARRDATLGAGSVRSGGASGSWEDAPATEEWDIGPDGKPRRRR